MPLRIEYKKLIKPTTVAGDEWQQLAESGTPATSGTYTITYDGQTTSAIPWNATASAVRTALLALSNIDDDPSPGVTVQGPRLQDGPQTIRFINHLRNTNVAEMTTTESLEPAGADVVVTTTTQGAAAVDQTVSLADFSGDSPVMVKLWATPLTADGFSVDQSYSVGFSDFTNNQFGAYAVEDGESGFTALQAFGPHTIRLLDGGSSPLGDMLCEGHVKDAAADEYKIEWTHNNTSAYIIHSLAIGGDAEGQAVEAFVGVSGVESTTGLKSITDVGFRPDCELFLIVGGTARSEPSLGFAVSSSEQGAIGGYTLGDDSSERQRDDQCFMKIAPDKGTVIEAEFVSQDSGGFTYDLTVAPLLGGAGLVYCCLNGVAAKVGKETSRTTSDGTGDKATTGAGFAPKGIIAQSNSRAAQDDVLPNFHHTIGAGTSSTKRGCTFIGNIDDVTNSESDHATESDLLLGLTTAGSPTVYDTEGDLKSLDADGMTIDWKKVSATARELLYLLLGDGTADVDEHDALFFGAWPP